LRRLATQDAATLPQSVWDSLMPQRQALATVLSRLPVEPFQPNDDNVAYWADLIGKTANLVAGLPSANRGELLRGMAIVFAATELLTEAVRTRVNQAQAYAFSIGAGAVATTQPRFGGPRLICLAIMPDWLPSERRTLLFSTDRNAGSPTRVHPSPPVETHCRRSNCRRPQAKPVPPRNPAAVK
jgi:hypothetical protein